MAVNLFEPRNDGTWYTEEEAAKLIGKTRQTLRNWRVGYTNAVGTYPPILTEGKEWKKLRQSKRAPVLMNPEWVHKIAKAHRTMTEVDA